MACLCEKCNKSCCSGAFQGLKNNSQNNEGGKFTQILLSKDEAQQIIDAGFANIVKSAGGGCFCIAIDENNVCPAFKNGRCLIYNVRPDVCRLYPFYFDNFSGLFVHKDCPADFSFELETNKLEILELIKKRVNFFIDMERNKNKK